MEIALKTMKKFITYHVIADIKLEGVSIEITANSLEDALEKAKSLDAADFIDIKGDYNDSDFDITGIWKG